MKTTIDNVNETRKAVTVTVPVSTIKEEEQALVNTFVQKVKIPGFRPGKAPAQMLKAKYGKEFAAELREKILTKAYKHVVDDSGLNIYSIVKVDLEGDEVSPSKDAIVTFTIDIKPSFELPTYKGIKVTVPAVNVTEEEIDEKIAEMRKQRTEYKVTEEAAKKGDYVKVSYEGKIDGQPIAEIISHKSIYGTQNHTWEEAGAENVPGVPAVIEALIGMKAGDEKTVTMHFPNDFKEKDLAGKTASYHIAVQEVRNPILPEINEDFLKGAQVETIDLLREKIKNELKTGKNHESEGAIREKIVKELLDSTSFAIPESAIADETDSILRSYMTRMMRYGATQAQFEQQKDQLIGEAQKAAVDRAKTNIILDAIVKLEKIELTNQDLQMRVMHEAYMAGVKPQQFVKQLEKDRQLVNEIRQAALFNKVLDFLRKESTVEFTGNETKSS